MQLMENLPWNCACRIFKIIKVRQSKCMAVLVARESYRRYVSAATSRQSRRRCITRICDRLTRSAGLPQGDSLGKRMWPYSILPGPSKTICFLCFCTALGKRRERRKVRPTSGWEMIIFSLTRWSKIKLTYYPECITKTPSSLLSLLTSNSDQSQLGSWSSLSNRGVIAFEYRGSRPWESKA